MIRVSSRESRVEVESRKSKVESGWWYSALVTAPQGALARGEETAACAGRIQSQLNRRAPTVECYSAPRSSTSAEWQHQARKRNTSSDESAALKRRSRLHCAMVVLRVA